MGKPSMKKSACQGGGNEDYTEGKSSPPRADVTVDENAIVGDPLHNQSQTFEMSLKDKTSQKGENMMKITTLVVGSFQDQAEKSNSPTIAISTDVSRSINRSTPGQNLLLKPDVDHEGVACSYHSISEEDASNDNDFSVNEIVAGEAGEPSTLPIAECVLRNQESSDIENQIERDVPPPALVHSITTGTLVDDVEIPAAAIVPGEKGFKVIYLQSKRINHVYLTSLLLVIISVVILLSVMVGNDMSTTQTTSTIKPSVVINNSEEEMPTSATNKILDSTTLPTVTAPPPKTTLTSKTTTMTTTTPTTTTTTTAKPSREDEIRARIKDISGDKIWNEGTPQYQAMKWLIDDDPRELPGDHPMLIQRYVLSLLHYQLNGSNWRFSFGYMTKRDECDWFGVTCCHWFSSSCIKGTVTRLGFSGNNFGRRNSK